MNIKNELLVGLLGLGLAGIASADEHQDKDMTNDGVGSFIETETITGKEVWDFHGNMIGSIDAVLVKPTGGENLVVLDADEWRDDESQIAIPLERFHVKRKNDEPDTLIYTLNTTREQIKGAPAYEDVTDPESYDESEVRSVYSYWKVRMGNAADASGRTMRDAAEAAGRAVDRAADATGEALEDAGEVIEDSVTGDE